MAEKPNHKASSQSSKLDENDLQRLEEDSRRQSECKFAFVELNSLNQFMYLCRPNSLLVICSHFLCFYKWHYFAVYKFCNFILKRTLEQKLFCIILRSSFVSIQV